VSEIEKKEKKARQELNEKSRELQQFKSELDLNKQRLEDSFERSKADNEKECKELSEKTNKY